MNILTDDIIHFFHKQSFIVVSTVDKNGNPHNSCKGLVEVNTDGQVYLIDLYKAKTYENLKRNSWISIAAVNEHHFKGYCLKGRARIVDAGEVGPRLARAWEKRITSRITQRVIRNMRGEKGHPHHPEALLPKPAYLIVVDVEEIVDLTPHPIRVEKELTNKMSPETKTTRTIRGTGTQKNLLASFAGESQARNRYTYFASVAKKAGYEQISAIFLETADNEKEHAKRFFKLLQGGELEISAAYPAGVIGDTPANLQAAADGENLEWTKLYKEAEDVARQEGFEDIAVQFKEIAEVEEQHERRYRRLLKNIREGRVFKREEVVKWKCRNCGYVSEGREAPEECPACAHPKAYYELLCENY